MKKQWILALGLVTALSLNACGVKPEEKDSGNTGMTNPWNYYESLKEAEEAAGFSFELPEEIDDSYKATAFGVMSGDTTILEVVYQNGDQEVIVRKSAGEGQDISGVYGFEEIETTEDDGMVQHIYAPTEEVEDEDAVLMTVDHDGYSWSIYVPDGLEENVVEDFMEVMEGEEG